MRVFRALGLFAAFMFFSSAAIAQHKAPTETQCRDMVNGMLLSMKSAPMRTERDRQGANEVIGRAEKIVSDNRSRGASECDSWRAIGDLVTKQ